MKEKYHHLQALRGIAASMVIVSHSLDSMVRYGSVPIQYQSVYFHLGQLGVDIFFVISGFIMYETTKDKFGSSFETIQFIKRRLIRIVPMYWVATIAFFVLSMFATHTQRTFTIDNLLNSLAFIPFVSSNGIMHPVDGSGWTLNYEIFFYAVFSVSLLFNRNKGTFFLIALFSILAISGMFLGSDKSTPTTEVEFYTRSITILFVVGVVLGIIFQKVKFTIKYPFLFIFILVVADRVWFSVMNSEYQNKGNVLQYIDWPIAIACVSIAIYAGKRVITSKTEHLIESLGDSSYSTYMLQVMVIPFFNRILPMKSIPMDIVFFILAMTFCHIAGMIMYRNFEIPVMRRLKSIFI